MRKLLFTLVILYIPFSLLSQVSLRDTVLTWQHHEFDLDTDYSMLWHTTNDNAIDTVQFNGKVLENELIRLVVLPEYGARIISFVYKPTGYEYLYQSECGSAYGINAGNFYYNWLMVYGGIFPTFPEPEHGKTWLLPWAYSVIQNTADTVTIRMEYTDSTSYSGAPGSFNNGITGITCQVYVRIYKNSAIWDFDVNLINNKNLGVAYEYWTCATLSPGSDIGNTGSPLNTELLAPIDKYEAAWSPGSWIGNWGDLRNFEEINFLSKWDDMGIAYAHNLNGNYWGTINQDNKEGIFRISDNIVTPGMKFWTWGKNNINNNLYDYSNGGADNYIELWGGNSLAFFEDALLAANQQLSWKESYVATSGMGGISGVNNEFGVYTSLSDSNELRFELNKFKLDDGYHADLTIAEENMNVFNQSYNYDELHVSENIDLSPYNLAANNYTIEITITDNQGGILLSAESLIEMPYTFIAKPDLSDFRIHNLGNRQVQLDLSQVDNFEVYLTDMMGRLIDCKHGHRSDVKLAVNHAGVYVITVTNADSRYTTKVLFK